MLILGIETATTNISVALVDGDQVRARFEVGNTRRHAETLVPAIQFLCAQSEIALREVGAIAVDVGPGLFTGLRVGVATATSLAFALDVGVVPVGSLSALALAARPYCWSGAVLTVLDARRREVYAGVYAADGSEVVAPFVAEPSAVRAIVTASGAVAGPPVLVGEGALRYATVLGPVVVGAPLVPDAVAIARLSAGRTVVGPDSIRLLYLREPDAELPKS